MKLDSEWMDDDREGGVSVFGEMATIIESAMNPTCASNVMSLLCRTAFRECKQVQDEAGSSLIWMPSLMCRSECERHFETWNSCLNALEKDPDAKQHFDTQMAAVVLPFICEPALAYNLLFAILP